MKNFHKENEFICNLCSITFSRKWSLKHHISTIHDGNKPNTKYQCEVCQQNFKCKRVLTVHIRKTHEKIKDCKCDLCPKEYYSERGLQCHKNEFHKMGNRFECEICNKSFTRRLTLKQHESIFHDGKDLKLPPKIHQCNQCPRSFRSEWFLNRHIKVTHDPYTEILKCDYDGCKSTFKLETRLNEHKRNKHERERIQCDLCKKSISWAGFENHLNSVHLNKRTFNCEFCNRSWNKKPYFINHMKKIHKEMTKI